MVKKALGLDLANLSDDLRKKHKIKDKVKGVVITAVDPNSPAAEKHLSPGMVIAEVQQQPVPTAADVQKPHRQLKKAGKKTVMLLVVTPDGDRASSWWACSKQTGERNSKWPGSSRPFSFRPARTRRAGSPAHRAAR